MLIACNLLNINRVVNTHSIMKKFTKYLLLAGALLIIVAKLQSTTYHPFPEQNARWNFHRTLVGMDGNYDESYSISLSGDTLIGNQSYHKLVSPYGGNICGAIRQDVAAKKVYYIAPSETTEHLLYDFTMQVGDTVRGYTQRAEFEDDTVISIDSVLVGDSYRKRWLVNSNYNIYFIEGIGSTYGLFERSPGNTYDFPDYSLLCYSENNQTLYPDSQTNCDLLTAIESNETNSDPIRILQVEGSLKIEFDNPDIVEICVMDLLGKVILRRSITSGQTIVIDNLQTGHYILTGLDNSNRLITKKIIHF